MAKGFKPYAARQGAEERKFDIWARDRLAIQRREGKQVGPEDWHDPARVIQVAYPDTTPCVMEGRILGCMNTPTEAVYLINRTEMAMSGVPDMARTHPCLAVPLCDNCRLMFFYHHRHYKCLTSWMQRVAWREHLAVATVRKQVVGVRAVVEQIILPRLTIAQDYLRIYQLHARRIEIADGQPLPVMEDGWEVVYIDWREHKITGRVTLVVGPISTYVGPTEC